MHEEPSGRLIRAETRWTVKTEAAESNAAQRLAEEVRRLETGPARQRPTTCGHLLGDDSCTGPSKPSTSRTRYPRSMREGLFRDHLPAGSIVEPSSVLPSFSFPSSGRTEGFRRGLVDAGRDGPRNEAATRASTIFHPSSNRAEIACTGAPAMSNYRSVRRATRGSRGASYFDLRENDSATRLNPDRFRNSED